MTKKQPISILDAFYRSKLKQTHSIGLFLKSAHSIGLFLKQAHSIGLNQETKLSKKQHIPYIYNIQLIDNQGRGHINNNCNINLLNAAVTHHHWFSVIDHHYHTPYIPSRECSRGVVMVVTSVKN